MGVFKCQVSAYWFLNHLGLTCRFLLYILRVIKLLEASDVTKHGRHLGNQEKKRRELVIFCAWHVKQHINKYFAPFYPQALLLSFKEVEKKNMQFHSKWFRTTCYCASYLRTIETQSSSSLLHSQVFSVVSWA